MSARRRAGSVAPLPLPQAPRITPFQRRLNVAVPYLVILLVALPVIAVFHRYVQASGAEFSFSFPSGDWIRGFRRFLHWVVFPLAVLGLAVWIGLKRRVVSVATMKYSRVRDTRALGMGMRARLAALPNALRVLAVAGWIMALMGPELRMREEVHEEEEGIDIMLVLDVSGSMQARDMYPDRLEAAKRVIDEFISHRTTDRIGLVLFGREAHWWCPLTRDYDALRTMLAEVRLGIVNPRGTAIGDAVGTALNRLRRSETKTRVIVLLTDGDNNAGILMPLKAAEYARVLNVKIYTVLIGVTDSDRTPGGLLRSRFPVNPKLLEEMAALTGGTPYLAGDTHAIRNSLQKILDSLEKDRLPARFEVSRRPIHNKFLGLGLVFLILEIILSLTVLRRFP